MFRPFVGHPQELYISICIKSKIINKQNDLKLYSNQYLSWCWYNIVIIQVYGAACVRLNCRYRTSRQPKGLMQFNLFFTFIIYFSYKYWCTLHEDFPQRVRRWRINSALIENSSYYNTVHLLVFSWILTISTPIWIQ